MRYTIFAEEVIRRDLRMEVEVYSESEAVKIAKQKDTTAWTVDEVSRKLEIKGCRLEKDKFIEDIVVETNKEFGLGNEPSEEETNG